jgi:hypothetical protein
MDTFRLRATRAPAARVPPPAQKAPVHEYVNLWESLDESHMYV